MRRGSGRGSSSVGLQIDGAGLRAVEVRRDPHHLVVVRRAFVPTPEGCMREFSPAALGAALRRLWTEGGFSLRRCTVVLSPQVLVGQMITLPPAPLREQRLIVQDELARFLAVEESSRLGWLPTAPGGGPGGNTLAFYLPETILLGFEQALAHAGLEAAAVEPGLVAALRLLVSPPPYRPAHLPDGGEQGALAALYWCDGCAELAFLESGRLRYYRRLDPVGGVSLGTGKEPSWRWWGLVSEVERSLRYYERAYAASPQPQELILLDEDRSLTSVVAVLQTELGLAVRLLDSAHLFSTEGTVPEGEAGPFWAALGAALRSLPDPAPEWKLDLRPPDEEPFLARHAPHLLRVSLVGSSVMVALAAVASVLLGARLGAARAELQAAEAALQAAVDDDRSVERARAIRERIARLREGALPVAPLLSVLGELVPHTVTLTSLELREDGSLTIEGSSRGHTPVIRLISRLTQDARFQAPVLEALQTRGSSQGVVFKVRAGLADRKMP